MPPKKSASVAGGKLSDLESKVYQAALSGNGNVITQDQLADRFKTIPLEDQLMAINGLLKKNLFTVQKVGDGIQYAATTKNEASLMGKLDDNENIVYTHIKDSRNEGIWTKQLKARTGLHQTIINRCLKSLEQKQLVKAVKSVKYPTRKIYMLYGLTPSIELSGGPWYTDNELDTGFINELSMACLNFVRSKSFAKSGQSRALLPVSYTSKLPSAQTVHQYLKNSGLTETELEVDHVVSLLEILVYDEQIEKIPVVPFAMGGSFGISNGNRHSDDSDRSSDSESESGSESDSDGSDSASLSGSGSDSDSESGSESDDDSNDGQDDQDNSSKKRKRSSSSSNSNSKSRKKSKRDSKSKSKSKKKKRSSSSSSSKKKKTSSSRSRSQSQSRSRSRSRSRSQSKAAESDSEDDSDQEDGQTDRNANPMVPFVYRAIRPLSVRVGWTETPCGHCPVFDFCDETGPVSAENCQYYGGKEDEYGRQIADGWVDAAIADDDQDEDEGEQDQGQGQEQKIKFDNDADDMVYDGAG